MDNRNTDAAIESSDDLSALAWVHDELRRSLDAAHKALRRFVKESEAMAGSDTDAVDPSVLRSARQQIHQGVGALELVGLPAAATMLRACEAAVQRFVLKPHKLTSSIVDDLERASFALLDYLTRILAGKTVSPLSLFPQFRAVQEAAGVDRVHPADLWAVDWRWHDLPDAGTPAAPRQTDPSTRQALEQQMLAMLRGNATVAAARMSDLFAGLGNGATNSRTATLWRMAAAVFEAQSQGLLTGDVFSKRVAARLLSQLRIIERGDTDVSERLAQDLLFFCAQATAPLAKERAPRLASVREAYHLDGYVATDYTVSPLGKFDPAWVTQARKRVGAAKESWSGVAGGEMHRMNGLSEQFALVGDSLRRLFPGGDSLAGELQQAVHIAQQGKTAPAAPLAMEVATSLLYVEASLEDAEFDNPEQSARVRRLADRIADVRRGATPAPLEGWMEDLYRRVSDRQTMGSVVQELRSSLSEVEKLIDQFFRKPDDRSVLIPVPGQLSSMRGVLSVLGMDQASTALLRMRDEVDGLATTEIAGADPAANPAFQRLAGNLGALGFLIDMLSVQPAMAKSLFTFDPVEGTLSPVMGRSTQRGQPAQVPETPTQIEPRLLEQAQMLAFTSVSEDVPLEQVTLDLSRLSEEAGLADQPGLKAAVRQAQASLERMEEGKDDAGILSIREQISEALVDFVHTASDPVGLAPELVIEPAPAPAPAPQVEDLAEDDEMREIFLEEAREVLEGANAAVAALVDQPDDLSQLTTLRRAYHTLKGSSRMVGLKAFGDAAWVCEQLYNTRLAEQQPADEPLLDATRWTLDYLGAWVEAIEARRDDGHVPSAVEVRVAALSGLPEVIEAAAPIELPMVEELPLVGEMTPVDELPSVFAGLEGLGLPPDLPTAADLDLSVPTQIELRASPVPAPAEPEVTFDLDLSQFEQPNAPPAEPVTLIQPRQTEINLLNLDFGSVRPEPATLIEPRVAELPTLIEPRVEELPTQIETRVEEPVTLAFDAPAEVADPATVIDVRATDEPAVELPTEIDARVEPVARAVAQATDEPSAQAADEPVVEIDAYAEEDQVKVVGPLRISIPLFNIFLTEADELSRRLTTEVAEWAMELHRPVGETAIALAHSLAGSSATVGFAQLSQLARGLEHALTRSNTIGNGTEEEGELFVAVAEEVRRLLHQFAAGFLKSPPPELLDRLHEHEVTSARRLDAATAAAELNDGTTGPGTLLPVAEAIDDADMIRVAELDQPTQAELDAPVIDETVIDVPAEADAPVSLMATLDEPATEAVAEPAADVGTSADATDTPDAPEIDTELSPFSRSVPAALTASADEGEEHVDLPFDDATATPLIEPLTEPSAQLQPSQPMPLVDAQISGFALPDTQFDALGQAELKPFVPLAAEVLRAAPARREDAAAEGDDEIDAVDAVDAELFPIFEEEAEELLPALHGHLRTWAQQPGDTAHAAACMRTLHTLKGGSRLAGAMRLGEMAHRLESRIELLLAHPQTDSSGVEALQGLADALSHTFDALRAHDQQAYDEAVASADDALHRDSLAASTRPAALTALTPLAAVEPESAAEPQADKRAVVPPAEQIVVPVARTPRPAPRVLPASEVASSLPEVDWSRFANSGPTTRRRAERVNNVNAAVRVRAPLLDRMVNQAGEVSITRSRIESEVGQIKGSLADLTDNLERLRQQLRDIELQAETQMSSRLEQAKQASQNFDPLEFDRFTRFQELTRMMAESVNDVATVQRTLQRTLETTEDELVAQARLTRDLQDDLLRTRMVEFESMSDRLYRVVRQAAKETGKHVRLDILGGSIEVDRGVLDRMVGAFEHLLRNSVTHGVESPEARAQAKKDATGSIVVALTQEGNEVGVEFRDDGAGLNLARIREKAQAQGLLDEQAQPTDADLANFIFTPGFSTADTVTELAGRGVGMDVVRSEVNAMGGRIETSTAAGQGTSFKLVLPLTTAVTQVVMVRIDNATVAIPSTLIEIVRRATVDEVKASYQHGAFAVGERSVPFFWLGSLLHLSPRSSEVPARTRQVLIIRSAQQRIALHVDEVLGNQEVVVKNLGPQLSRMPGLAGLTLLASGAVALIYNPVALATLYGTEARAATVAALTAEIAAAAAGHGQPVQPVVPVMRAAEVPQAPLVLVVDDSLTVRRVTQRLLTREGYRVTLAKDGLDALERLAEEKPAIVLSDIEMPRMDGFDLVRNIRNDTRLRDLPVIMITSRIAQKHRDYAAELGVDHYLGKPYSEEDLLVLIGRYTADHAMPA